MFFSTVVATLLVAASAADISSTSTAGANLLANARSLNQNYEDDYSWMAKYSLKFEGCHTIHTYGGEAGNAEEGGSPFGVQHLAKFKLCNSNKSCTACGDSGVYMVDLQQYAEVYLQAQQEIQESQCEAVQENCNCDYYNGDDEACMSKCYSDAGLSFCEQEDDGFDAAEYLECREAEFYYNGNNVQYYIGPVCSHSGKSVTLAVFTDSSCTQKAASNTFEKYNNGSKLPYSNTPMISTKCMSCKVEEEQADDDANANQYYQEPETSDTCTQLYEESAKCEKNLSVKNKYSKDTGSCEYIHKIVPALENVYHAKGGGLATGFAVFFGLTTIAAAGIAYHFYTKVERSTVGLSDKEGSLA